MTCYTHASCSGSKKMDGDMDTSHTSHTSKGKGKKKSFRWTDEMQVVLIQCLSDYKTKCEFLMILLLFSKRLCNIASSLAFA